MDVVRSHFGKMQLWEVEHFCLHKKVPVQYTGTYLFVKTKVFNFLSLMRSDFLQNPYFSVSNGTGICCHAGQRDKCFLIVPGQRDNFFCIEEYQFKSKFFDTYQQFLNSFISYMMPKFWQLGTTTIHKIQ